ncbi:DNA-binding response regulator, OmpR family, contains REC and winged-helix (wHTH) domain [Burkholderia sp. YR290]|jgi:two-component system OmpR family response regulator|uniref:response regulator transcription factor n=1 Tax=Paraburkholderia hospita TaxID=169430 RepID=UPI0009A60452|nr:response regulator transcription factor [Paraburkholderia hospita]SKC93156.1 DNA-binding response regulator, OmpR family, contains REC and winged-helix (wHTH) domain [Paraburkholderia hospita]SOE90375.1 DNA-binding response regulator, OmpR family, contains REC and winged-helix (wHTH) domain [Burkholderia sp. YR290]
MRVLLIEDDVQVGNDLCRTLKAAEFSVDWVRDGRTGKRAIEAAYYAIVLLDLGLPDMTGLDVLHALRAAGNSVPVVILSTEDDLDASVCSLEAGADDCVLKPFAIRELFARIRAVLRRRAGYATSAIGDGSLSLDLEKRTLNCNGIASSLSAREFALMHAFLEKRGTILSRGQLEDRLYGWGREVESNAVDVLIHSVRKKFGQSLIRNVRGLSWTIAHANA